MNKIIYFVAGGFLGWYLGTQKEERTRQLFNQLRAEARELKLQLQKKYQENQQFKTEAVANEIIEEGEDIADVNED